MSHFTDLGRLANSNSKQSHTAPNILSLSNFQPRSVPPSKVKSHQAQYCVRGIGYASASEAACALLMERYIPFFKIKEGESYQVELGKNQSGATCHADFQIHGRTIFEFHPPRFWMKGNRLGEFASFKERSDYYQEFRASRGAERKQIKQAMIKRLSLNYSLKRREIMEGSEENRHKTLIVAKDAQDFYQKIIKEFGVDVPTEQKFVAQFEGLRNDIYKRMKIKNSKPDRGPAGASLDRKKAA